MKTTLAFALLSALLLAAAVPPVAAQDGPPLYTRWTSFDRSDGLPADKVFCVLADGDDVWAGTEGGLARLRDGAFEVFPPLAQLPHRVVSCLALSPRTGDLWVGTLGGLCRLSAGRVDRFTQLDSGLINDVVYAVEVVDGDVWAATAAGLSVYHPDDGSWDLFDHTNTVMHEPWCYGLAQAPGLLYVAVWGGGVVEHDRQRRSWKAYRDPDGEMEIDLFRDDGLVHDVTSAVAFADGALWVGTYFGLSRYDGRAWRGYLEHDTPLPSNFINTVRAAGRWAFLGTDAGLAAFDGSTWLVWGRGTSSRPGQLTVHEADSEPRPLPLAGSPVHDYILGLAPVPGGLWVATAAGLSHGTTLPNDEAGPSRQERRNP